MRIRDPAGERAPAARLVAPGSPLPHLLPRVRLTDADPSRTAALGTPPPGLTQNDVLLGRWEGLAVVLRHPLTKPSHRRRKKKHPTKESKDHWKNEISEER
ncbi:uncharacterized protein LOC143268403 isoform X3 [Peromyscus maniculatus bairdii]|uniref:uncharacterized protein LOC143268403 isoform X3 n=1 Tax=Peromyscus maniculatus bairdii TaxID=230844 RepID=UPI003FD5214B